jgi:cation transport protein ChaC
LHKKNPGRVVTLVHKEDWDVFSGSDSFPDDDIVWGVAYTIDPIYEAEVRDYLDYREKDGYTLETLNIYGIVDNSEKIIIYNAFCYVGRNDNPSFIGSEPIDLLARRIWQSVGPSGPNKEYLYNLAAAVKQLAPESYDSHLNALEVYLFCFARVAIQLKN